MCQWLYGQGRGRRSRGIRVIRNSTAGLVDKKKQKSYFLLPQHNIVCIYMKPLLGDYDRPCLFLFNFTDTVRQIRLTFSYSRTRTLMFRVQSLYVELQINRLWSVGLQVDVQSFKRSLINLLDWLVLQSWELTSEWYLHIWLSSFLCRHFQSFPHRVLYPFSNLYFFFFILSSFLHMILHISCFSS